MQENAKSREKFKAGRDLLTLAKGAIVGGTMLVPGFSGGSMAMILGVYDRLVSSVNSVVRRKSLKSSLLFLIIFALGGGCGLLLFAKPLELLFTNFPRYMGYFFMGAVAGSIPMMLREARITKFKVSYPFFAAAGICAVLLLGLLPTDLVNAGAADGVVRFIILVGVGIIAAIALVLPGISFSHFLYLLGLYEALTSAISGLDIGFLLPLGIGVMLGVLLTTGVLEFFMKKFTSPTYLIIFGFLIGSVIDVFPGLPTGIEWLFCPLLLAAGFFAIFFLSKLEEKRSAEQ